MRNERPGRTVIRTSEGISFTLPLATPVLRLLAWLLDLGVILLAWLLVQRLAQLLNLVGADWRRAFLALAYFILSVGYGIVLEWGWRGQTLGKRVLRLRVMDEQGVRLRLPQVIMRNHYCPTISQTASTA